jgi:myogenesis-regulating glycosidase
MKHTRILGRRASSPGRVRLDPSRLWKWLLLPAVVAVLAAALPPAGSAATSSGVGVQVVESPGRVDVMGPRFSVSIREKPYRIAVLYGDRVILESAPGSAFVEVSDKDYRPNAFARTRAVPGGVHVTWATEDPAVELDLALRFERDVLHVDWSATARQPVDRFGESFVLERSGHWYGGNVTSAHIWPLETGSMRLDPFLSTSNQTTPAWLTSSGTGILAKTYQPMGFSINDRRDGRFSFHFKGVSRFNYRILVGANIVETHRTLIRLLGKPRQVPLKEYFTEPIFNTWIEYMTEVSQRDVLDYARRIRDSGFPFHVLDLDDGWATRYGDHEFDPAKFPDPRAMVAEIHRLGFKFALWVVPFIEPAAKAYPVARERGFLVNGPDGRSPLSVRWWNGDAGLIDLSNPKAYEWFKSALFELQKEYGIDGFKLDAGDAQYLPNDATTFGRITPNRYTDLFAGLGRFFDINELRVSWLTQDMGLVQRLRDKNSNWSAESGLASIVPHGLAVSMIGYPYFCPDIIGGGLDSDFLDPAFEGMDPELFVRWTQAAALMPMMQFSYAPWRLEERYTEICRRYANLHRDLGDYIYTLALRAASDGTPIVRPLFFRNPEDPATYTIGDQFMLGDRFLVAPVLEKGVEARDVYLPAGLWKDFWSGEMHSGNRWLRAYPAPLEKLPVFVSIQESLLSSARGSTLARGRADRAGKELRWLLRTPDVAFRANSARAPESPPWLFGF